MASDTTVPPWVQIFAAFNTENVEIIEMTNPIITGMTNEKEPIEARLHESVFLLRICWTPAMVKTLESIVVKTFPAIQESHRKQQKATRVGNQSYHAWQSVRHQNCSCMYNYAGTKNHILYHYTPIMDDLVNEEKQPALINQMLDDLWSQ